MSENLRYDWESERLHLLHPTDMIGSLRAMAIHLRRVTLLEQWGY